MTFVCDCVNVSAGGCVMVNVFVIEHPAGELIVHVYVPAQRPLAVAPVPPEGVHAYVYVPVPPEATTVADPLHAPLHVTFTCEVVAVIAGGCVMLNVAVVVHVEGPEVITQEYEPAQSEEAVAPVPPLGDHAYVYVPVPPEATTEALPVHEPLHVTFTCDCVKVIAGGCVIVKVFVIEHPAGELIVQVYVPAQRPLAVAPVPPLGAQAYV